MKITHSFTQVPSVIFEGVLDEASNLFYVALRPFFFPLEMCFLRFYFERFGHYDLLACLELCPWSLIHSILIHEF